MNRKSFVTGLIFMCFTTMSGLSYAGQDTFPSQPITIVVPYAAGGIGDVMSRVIADAAADRIGQPIIVDSKPGGNSAIGTLAMMRAPADGHTWLLAAPALIANPFLYQDNRWGLKDFIGVNITARAPGVVVVPKDVPSSTFAEFISMAQASPGKYNYGNPGIGSSMHLNTEMLMQAAKIELQSIVYSGQPPAILGLLRNDVSVMLPSTGLVIEHIKKGSLKALAVISKERDPQLPETPTLTEEGYPDSVVIPWYGFAVSKDTPPDITNRINEVLNQVLADPEVQKRLRGLSLEPERPMNLEEIAAEIQSDANSYEQTVRNANLVVQ